MRVYKVFLKKRTQKQVKELIWEITLLTLNSKINLLHQLVSKTCNITDSLCFIDKFNV